jgi:nicotinamide-nucleotide amidase
VKEANAPFLGAIRRYRTPPAHHPSGGFVRWKKGYGATGGAENVDDRTVETAEAIAERLGERRVTVAESCTAGRVASALACVDHATDWFRGGVVAYQREAKEQILDVTAASVLSEEAAEQMASGACKVFDADIAVSTTGLAGGDPQDGVEVGTVFIGTCVDGRVRSRRHHFDGDPEDVCAAATRQALIDLLGDVG